MPFVIGEMIADILLENFKQNDAAGRIRVDDNALGSSDSYKPCSDFASMAECFNVNIRLASYNNNFGTKVR